MTLEIHIDDMVYQEVMHYVNTSEFEVSGLGSVVVEEQEGVPILRVVSCILLPQENTRAHTEIPPEAFGKAEYEHHLSGAPGTLRWWWHSHVTMPVFWSGEDRGNIRDLSDEGWFCATVFNQAEEMRSAFRQSAVAGPVPLFIDELPTYIHRPIPDELTKAWDEKYKANVENSISIFGISSQVQGARQVYAGPGRSQHIPEEHWWNGPVTGETADMFTDAGKEEEETEIDVMDKILDVAIEAGLSLDEAEDFAATAERLMEDGHYSHAAIERALIDRVLSTANKKNMGGHKS